MIKKLRVKRGLKKNLPALDVGELALTTDESKLYVGHADGNQGLVTDKELTLVNTEIGKVATQLAQTNEGIDRNSYTRQDKVKIILHRGFSEVAPENTLPAYVMAGRANVFGAECDVACTTDGVWELMHDATVDKTTNGTGTVTAMTHAQIQALTVDYGANIAKYPNLKVPTLDEYLSVCKRYNLMPLIEIKAATNDAHYQALVDTIIKWGFEYKCIVLCLQFAPLLKVRALNKNIKLTFNTVLAEVDGIAGALAPNSAMLFSGANVTKAAIEYCHSKNLEVLTMIVDDYTTAMQHAKWGADYIITNRITEVF